MNNFNYQKFCQDCLKGLPQRTISVIERRFGLKTKKRETLESIGKSHGITRERVRQIESEGLSKAKSIIKENQEILKHFKQVLASFGNVKKEEELLNILGDGKYQNQVFFILANYQDFKRSPEVDSFHAFWFLDKKSVEKAKKTVNSIVQKLKKENKLFSFEELLKTQALDKNVFLSYVEISKEIRKNPDGKYGLKNWIEISPKGVKDKAYLVLKEKEKPLHFKEIASLIEGLPFSNAKKAHTATVHNELIKDSRFVLVGRGLYALNEWGYQPGVVKDIIADLLKNSKESLTKDQILEKVLSQRFVKENTVLLNLQNRNYFARDEKGRYNIREA